MTDSLWNYDDPIADLTTEVTIPPWIDPDISPSTVAAILQGGCASGTYLPAVTGTAALDTMHRYGDGVLRYLEDTRGEIPVPADNSSWTRLAVYYLTCAVEMWALSIQGALTDILTTGDSA